MTDDWMPTTEQVRDAYAIDSADEYRDPINAPANRRANERYFDRWLEGHDREVAAQTLEDLGNQWGDDQYIRHYLLGEARFIRARGRQ